MGKLLLEFAVVVSIIFSSCVEGDNSARQIIQLNTSDTFRHEPRLNHKGQLDSVVYKQQ
jgi:hypothetical protein